MNKNKQHINQQQLLQLLMNIDKSQFNFIVTTTKVRMNKTNNPYYNRIIKKTKKISLPVTNYKGRVNNINDTTDFEPQPSSVGVHVSECVLYNEKFDRYYFNYEFFNDKPNVSFTMNGEDIDRNEFKDFEVKRNYDPTKPKFNSVMVNNIKEISMNKVHYIVDM